MAEIEKRDKQAVNTTAAEQLSESGPSYSPDVDIYVSDDELMIVADVPGVEKGEVNIAIDEDDTLILKAKSSVEEVSEPIMRQYEVGNYYRAFRLSEGYDKDKISATLENGVLELHVPKKEETKPRRIEIQA